MKFAIVRWLCAVGVLATLSGCVTTPSVPYDRAQSGVRTLGYLTPAAPDEPTMWQAASPGQSFGLVGALVDAGVQSVREGKFEKIVAAQAFDARTSFVGAVGKAVESEGYAVRAVTAERKEGEYLARYPTASNGEDAWLDVVLTGYGYVTAGMTSPWRPFAHVKVKLVRVSDGKLLMEHVIEYASIANMEGVITIPPDPQYAFDDIDAMEADPAKAMEGMRVAFQQVSSTIARLLK